jgi:GNAT superfamily N-acetyltransferase
LSVPREFDLYTRGIETLLASWVVFARGATGASLQHFPGVAVAVFPHEPDYAIYNNAVLQRSLEAAARGAALDAMEAAYATAGVARFAAWVHETDVAMRAELEARGYVLDSTTRAMGLVLDDGYRRPSEIDAQHLDWREYVRMFGLPSGLLVDLDFSAFDSLAAYLDGEPVAAALALDHAGDCGIYNVGTLEHARGRGLASALTARQVHDARERGCQTVSLQATPMAERLYARVGFSDLGRFLEFMPRT